MDPLSSADAAARFVMHLDVVASPHTSEAYQRDLASLQAYLAEREHPGHIDVRAIDVPVLRAWLGKYSRTRAPTSVARAIHATRSWMRWLEQRKVVDANPAEGIANPKVVRPMPRFLSEPQAETLVEAPARERVWTSHERAKNARDRAVLELLYSSALRATELAAINLGEVSFDDRCVVVTGKGDRERMVPIGAPALTAIHAWLEVRSAFVTVRSDDDDRRALFLTARGSRLDRHAVRGLVRAWGRKAGLQPLYPHALRHTCATHMLEGGADLRAIQEFLGHASLRTTERYTHLSTGHMRSVYAKAHPLAKTGKTRRPGEELEAIRAARRVR